jgi:hypothetical protein
LLEEIRFPTNFPRVLSALKKNHEDETLASVSLKELI